MTGVVLRRGREGGARVRRRRGGCCAFCAVITALSLAAAKIQYKHKIKTMRCGSLDVTEMGLVPSKLYSNSAILPNNRVNSHNPSIGTVLSTGR